MHSSFDFRNGLFAAYNERLMESIKEAISRKDPTIDWSQAVMVVDFEIGHVHVESKNRAMHDQIETAFRQVIAEANSEKLA